MQDGFKRLYDKMWLFYDFFQPVMRLSEKKWLYQEEQPSRIKRCHDVARTPFDRLCETKAISKERRAQLKTLRDQTNPRQFRQEIYELIDHISCLPGAVPGTTEDVLQTLSATIDLGKEQTRPVTFSFD